MRLEFDPMEMAARNIMDMTMIGAKIQNNKVLRVFDCVHSDTNAPDKIVMRIVFGTEVVKNALSLRFIEDKVLDVVLTGVDGIGRVYPREVSKELLYDENVGGYVSAKQYVLDVEGTNLLDLSSIPNTDPFRSFSNDIYEVLEVFGIETVRVMLYEEFMEVFTTEYVNYHHMITLIDTMTFPGRILEANRFGMNKSESGVLAKSSFEETSKILFNAALSADFDNMRGVSANIMFGQKPPCGTGFVDILIDETKLPDGSEEVSVFEAELSAANQHVEELENKPGCQMEDILMEW
jgi:DNA-directed RNA polymerase beta' subunit